MDVGVVGCGRIAQIMHLPNVAEEPRTRLAAVADPAANVVEAVGDRYGVDDGYTDPARLIEERGDVLDGLIVSSPMHTHADVAVPALAAGLDVLVEKPLAVTPADADRLVAAARDSDATAMVAYNRRYEPAFDLARQEIAALDRIDLVTCVDVDPDFSQSVPRVYDIVAPELPEDVLAESADRRRDQVVAAVGDDDLADAFAFQVEHVCHDVNLLRALFGDVDSVQHVDVFADGRYATAALRFEGGLRCLLESGRSERHWYEESVRVDAPDRVITLEYYHPMIRYNPATLRVKRGTGDTRDTRYSPTYEEGFKRELEAFVDAAAGQAPVRTTFAEARDDLALVVDLFEACRDRRD